RQGREHRRFNLLATEGLILNGRQNPLQTDRGRSVRRQQQVTTVAQHKFAQPTPELGRLRVTGFRMNYLNVRGISFACHAPFLDAGTGRQELCHSSKRPFRRDVLATSLLSMTTIAKVLHSLACSPPYM